MRHPRFHPRIAQLLTIDLRSLAACRIALGIVLLLDLAIRFREIPAFFIDTGLFPREFMPPSPVQWSLHAVDGGPQWVGLVFGVHALAACLLILGAWTRLATIVCWLLAVSLQARNPLIANSGDALLRMALLWGMFLPWGRRWSVDARRLERPATTGPSWPAAAILLQLCLVYWVTGALKLNADWLGGSGLHKLTQLDFCIRPLGRALADYPAPLAWMSRLVPWIELAAPLLVWSPWRTAAVRTVVVLGMIGFHGGIELMLHVGMFGLVSQAYWLVFLPSAVWDRLVGADPAVASSNVEAGPSPRVRAAPSGWARWRRRVASAGCAALLLMVILFNLHTLQRAGRVGGPPDTESGPRLSADAVQRVDPGWLPHGLKLAGDALMMHQNWTMFVRPPVIDSWVVAWAELPGGRRIDALRGGAPWSDNGAPRRAARLASQHWRYYLIRIAQAGYEPLAQRAAQWLLASWNTRHGPQQQASHLQLVLYQQHYGETGYQTRVLAAAGEKPFDLDSALRRLDALTP